MRCERVLSAALVLCRLLSGPLAQEVNVVRVEVNVTSHAGSSVYLDQGQEKGIEPGDVLRLFPPNGSRIVGAVRNVSRNSSRAELAGETADFDVGTGGVVIVPVDRLKGEQESADQDASPPTGPEVQGQSEPEVTQERSEDTGGAEANHPPWESPVVNWDPDGPLLAAPSNKEEYAEQESRRPILTRGRLYTLFDYTRDDSFGSRDYLLSRSGIDLQYEELFRQDGELGIDVDYYYRRSEVDEGDDEQEDRVRVNELSYSWGGWRREQPSANRYEVGRFLQREFPEFGFLDGAEYVHRFSSGSRAGLSVGYMPEPDDEFQSGDDIQVALFYRHVFDEADPFALGLGYQKSWHEGDADRDLLVSTLDYHPSRRLSVFATAWVDYYTSEDEIKSSGFELTQFNFNGNYSWEGGHGVGLFATFIRYPETLRDEFTPLPDDEIDDDKVLRAGLSAYRRLTKRIRLSGRVSGWDDQDDSGGNGNMRIGLRDIFYQRGEVSLNAFVSNGKFSDVQGLRLTANKSLEQSFLTLSWDLSNYKQDGFSGTQEDLLNHTVRGSWDRNFGRKWSLSLYLEDRFGDDQDSLGAGFLLQRVF